MTVAKMIAVLLISFVIAVIVTKFEIPFLRRKAGQNIREDGMQTHLSKAGTPSMGGISIIIGTCVASVIASVAFGCNMVETLAIIIVFLGFGIIGFIDDYAKVMKKQNEGLTVKQKLVLQILLCVAFAVLHTLNSDYGTTVYFPIIDKFVDFGAIYYVFVVFVVLAMTNAVNLTDGLDGLASGVTSIVSIYFAIAGVIFAAKLGTGNMTEPYFFAALCGGCLGFLVFNKNPAKIFMGDTGSLALGGGIAAAAIVMKLELLILVAGLLYVIEALSVVLQVGYFKLTHGKRIFKMAPIHHHFEMCGMSERQVVGSFWTFTLICCIIAMFMI